MKNESNLHEMIDILTELQKYVPVVSEEITLDTEDGIITTTEKNVHPIILGGDQWTVARARSALAVRLCERDSVRQYAVLQFVYL